MRIPFLLFILLLTPALAALGYDMYQFQSNLEDNQTISIERFQADFKLSDLGFILKQQSPETLNMLATNVPEDMIPTVEALLKTKALYITLGSSGALLALFLLLGLLGLGPCKKSN